MAEFFSEDENEPRTLNEDELGSPPTTEIPKRAKKALTPRSKSDIQKDILKYNPRYETLKYAKLNVARYVEGEDGEPIAAPEFYQRDVMQNWVNEIAENYNPLLRTPLLVAHRKDGSYWVVNGQQHMEAEKLLGFKEGVCFVFESEGPRHEAGIFSLSNRKVRKITPLEMYRADLPNNFNYAQDITTALEKFGYRFSKDKQTFKISGVAWTRLAYERYHKSEVDSRSAESKKRIVYPFWNYNDEQLTSFELAMALHRDIFFGEVPFLNEFWCSAHARFLHEILKHNAHFVLERHISKLRQNYAMVMRNAAFPGVKFENPVEAHARSLARSVPGAFRVNTFSYALQELYNSADEGAGRGRRRGFIRLNIFTEAGNYDGFHGNNQEIKEAS